MKRNSWFVGVLGFVAVSASSGCSSDSASEFDSLRMSTVRRYTKDGNGPQTNGKGNNGKSNNGKSNNGKSNNGKSLQGLSVASSTASQNRSLVAVEMDTNRNMRGADFVGLFREVSG